MHLTIETLPRGRHAVSFDHDPEITALLKMAVPSYARRWDRSNREWIIDTIYPLRCFVEAMRCRGYSIDGDVPDMPVCRDCETPLSQHNIVGLCRECRLIATNQRLTGQQHTADPVTHREAITNVGAVLGGHIIADTHPETARKGSDTIT